MKIDIHFKGNTFTLDFKKVAPGSFKTIKEGGVYMIFNVYREIIYVGVTGNIGKRLSEHFKGRTHTSHFTEEMFSAVYYVENDEYERDVLEKLLIHQFRPVHNATSENSANRRLTTADIMDIRWYANNGDYSYKQIAKEYDVSVTQVGKIANDHLYPSVKVPRNYTPAKLVVADKFLISKEDLEKAYIMILKGHSHKKASEETGVKYSTLQCFLRGETTRYEKLRKELEEKHGKISRGKKYISDELVNRVLTLRYVDNLSLEDICIEMGLGKVTTNRICYGVGRFKEVKEKFLENLV